MKQEASLPVFGTAEGADDIQPQEDEEEENETEEHDNNYDNDNTIGSKSGSRRKSSSSREKEPKDDNESREESADDPGAFPHKVELCQKTQDSCWSHDMGNGHGLM